LLDANGDGKTDALCGITQTNGPTNLTLYLSTGNGFVAESTIQVQNFAGSFEVTPIADFNGDGKQDLIIGNTLYYSTGTGFVTFGSVTPPSGTEFVTFQTGDFEGDGGTDALASTNNLYRFPYTPELINSIKDGLGATTTVIYDRLNSQNPYTYQKGSGDSAATDHMRDMIGPQYVVTEVETDNGIGGTYNLNYTYFDGRVDTQGRGFLGFKQINKSDPQLGTVEATTYSIGNGYGGSPSFAQNGQVLSDIIETNCGPISCAETLSDTENTYNIVNEGYGRYFVGLCKSSVQRWDVDANHTQFPAVTTTYQYDFDGSGGSCSNPSTSSGYGDVDVETTQTFLNLADFQTKTTTNTYCDNVTNVTWYPGELTKTVVTSTLDQDNNPTSLTRQSSFEHDYSTSCGTATPLITTETIEPENSDQTYSSTTYGYDDFGNRASWRYGYAISTTGCVFDFSNGTCSLSQASATRNTGISYDPQGEFMVSRTNPLTQTETWDYSQKFAQAFGVPDSHTDINNQTTTWTWDDFDRETFEERPDKTFTQFVYAISAFGCAGMGLPSGDTCPTDSSGNILPIPFAVYTCPYNQSGPYLCVGGQNGPITVTFYDKLSRVVATDTQGFNGCWIRVQNQYDANLNLISTTRPFFVGAPSSSCSASTQETTTFNYNNGTLPDPYHRLASATYPLPGGSSTTTVYSYAGPTTTVIKNFWLSDQEATTTVMNAEGYVAQVTDALSETTTYTHDPFGDLTEITDPVSNLTKYSYDVRGRRTNLTDPDLGTYQFWYDGFSDLVLQQSPNEAPKFEFTFMTYDALDRMLTRIEPDMTSTWTYDTATNGIGEMATAQCAPTNTSDSNGINACPSSTSYTRTYSYDQYGRQEGLNIAWNGQSYSTTTTYDDCVLSSGACENGATGTGKIAQVQSFSGFTTLRQYNEYGFLSTIVNPATNAAYWTAVSRDQELHLTAANDANGLDTVWNYYPETGRLDTICASTPKKTSCGMANLSYQWDASGNLVERGDTLNGAWSEQFCYDLLNRLTAYSTAGGTCPNLTSPTTVAYDAPYSPGDIVSKSDLGTYAYPAPGSSQPQAVSSIQLCSSCTFDDITNPKNGSVSANFFYDADGNPLCITSKTACDSAAKRQMTYYQSNQVAQIIADSKTLNLTYNPEHERATVALAGGKTTEYLNDPASLVRSEYDVTKPNDNWLDYVEDDDGNIVFEQNVTAAGVSDTDYVVRDLLGSISLDTDSNGAILADGTVSYDAWGKMRAATTTADTSCALPDEFPSPRGFTSQESVLDDCPAINFNARLYDASLGRFLQPDSTIPDTYNLQSLNHYSYVNNGPLSATDPTGNDPFIDVVTVTAPYAYVGTPVGDNDVPGITNYAASSASGYVGAVSAAALASPSNGQYNPAVQTPAATNSQNPDDQNTNQTGQDSAQGQNSDGSNSDASNNAQGGTKPECSGDSCGIETVVVVGHRQASDAQKLPTTTSSIGSAFQQMGNELRAVLNTPGGRLVVQDLRKYGTGARKLGGQATMYGVVGVAIGSTTLNGPITTGALAVTAGGATVETVGSIMDATGAYLQSIQEGNIAPFANALSQDAEPDVEVP
jgi:RHS repeat-associated protein